jgi:hypothetical protein
MLYNINYGQNNMHNNTDQKYIRGRGLSTVEVSKMKNNNVWNQNPVLFKQCILLRKYFQENKGNRWKAYQNASWISALAGSSFPPAKNASHASLYS